MDNTRIAAQTEYRQAEKALRKFCDENTDLELHVLDGQYPISLQFVPTSQLNLVGNENIDENGEVNDLTVTVGLTTTVKSTLKFKMDSKFLKKLIKLAETVGQLYYQAFREEQGERITAKRPVALDDLEPHILYCPECGSKLTDVNACDEERIFENKPFCCRCGQSLDWVVLDEMEAGGNE